MHSETLFCAVIQHEIWDSMWDLNYSLTPQNFVGSKGFWNWDAAVNVTEIQLSPFLKSKQKHI